MSDMRSQSAKSNGHGPLRGVALLCMHTTPGIKIATPSSTNCRLPAHWWALLGPSSCRPRRSASSGIGRIGRRHDLRRKPRQKTADQGCAARASTIFKVLQRADPRAKVGAACWTHRTLDKPPRLDPDPMSSGPVGFQPTGGREIRAAVTAQKLAVALIEGDVIPRLILNLLLIRLGQELPDERTPLLRPPKPEGFPNAWAIPRTAELRHLVRHDFGKVLQAVNEACTPMIPSPLLQQRAEIRRSPRGNTTSVSEQLRGLPRGEGWHLQSCTRLAVGGQNLPVERLPEHTVYAS